MKTHRCVRRWIVLRTSGHGGGRDRKRPGGRCQLCGIRALRQGLSISKNSRFSRRAASHCTIAHTIFSRTRHLLVTSHTLHATLRFACKHCRVILCDGCWDLWDHTNERAPSELPPAAAGASRPVQSPDASPASASPSPPRCPEGHVMTTNEIRGGLMCDGCKRDLGCNGESVFFSCAVTVTSTSVSHVARTRSLLSAPTAPMPAVRTSQSRSPSRLHMCHAREKLSASQAGMRGIELRMPRRRAPPTRAPLGASARLSTSGWLQ